VDHPLDQAEGRRIGRSCVCSNVRRTARAVTRLYDEALRPSGLTGPQFGLLAAVRVLGPVSVTRLAAGSDADRTTLTRNLKLLARDGFVQVETGRDQRTRQVGLTDKGREALARALPLWEQAQARVEEVLGAEQTAGLLSSLSWLVSGLRPSAG
jgi:DNA-binding MarR family transcriptional regulator